MTNPLIFVLLPILSGLLLYVLKSRYSRYLALIPQGFLLGLSLYILHSFSRGNDQQISSLLAGVPLPFGMSLQYDNLTAIFLVITNLLFLLMVVFDFNKTTINYFFIFFFLSLQGLVNGVFLSTDFFNVYVVLEAATVVVTILIMFKKRIQALYDGMIYLMVNMVAMAFFLFGIGYLYKLVGVLDFASVSESIVLLSSPRDLALPLGFLLTAVVVKSAAFPMFSWLPKAHGAHSSPYVVSAVLSGIFVMTGVYLTLRIYQVFLPVIDLAPYLFVIGLITSITGFCLAISQKDIKLILAYHSVSQVGLIMSGLYGLSPYGYAGGIYHIFAHALFKGMLFLLAGLLIGVFGTRRITDMHGLWRDNKLMATAVVVGVLSITGAPFFSGGFSKYMISYGYSSIYFKGLYTLINAGTMISFIKFLKILPAKGHAPNHIVLSNPKSAVLILMSSLCLVMGLFGQSIASYLFGTAPSYSLLQQIQKLPMYLLTFGASYLLYEKILHHFNLEAMVAKLELSFNGMMVAMSGFFAFTLVYLIKFGF